MSSNTNNVSNNVAKKTNTTTISKKIVNVVLISIISIMVVFALYSFISDRTKMYNQLYKDAKKIQLRLTDGLVIPLWNLDFAGIEKLVSLEMENENVLAIAVNTVGEGDPQYLCKYKKKGSVVSFEYNNNTKSEIEKASFYSQKSDIVKDGTKLGDIIVYYTDKYLREQLMITIIVIIIQTVVLAGLITFIIISIVNSIVVTPLNNILNRIIDISEGEGDLTKKLVIVSNDEIGILAENINNFIEKLRNLINNIKENANVSIETGEILFDNSEDGIERANEVIINLNNMEQGFNTLNDNIDNSTSAIEEIVKNINSLNFEISNQVASVEESSASIQKMIETLNNLAETIKIKKESTDKLVQITKEGEEKVSKTNEIIEEIGKEAENMLEMIEIINRISDTTNTLAVNAAIQAAHAGEHGKGFAVVASEIKNLAESTLKNANDMSAALLETITRIKNATISSSESGASFQKIKNEVNEVSQVFNSIYNTTTEMSSNSEEILKEIKKLITITENVKLSYNNINANSNETKEAMENMQKIFKSVLKITKDIMQNIVGLKNINYQLLKRGEINRKNIEAMSVMINRFRSYSGNVKLILPTDVDGDHYYYHELLKVALEYVGMNVEIISTDPATMKDNIIALDNDRISAYWLIRSDEKDKLYTPVEVDILNGLVGNRILLIPKGKQSEYDNISNISDFRKLGKTVGLGKGWYDVIIWRENNLNYFEYDGNFKDVYEMLEKGDPRVDYISMRPHEILSEAKKHPLLYIEKNLVFVYKRELIFYLSKSASYLKPILENALHKLYVEGIITDLLKKYYNEIYDISKLNILNRKRIKLISPRE